MQIWFLSPSPIISAKILLEKSPKRAHKYVIEFMQATAYLCEKYGVDLPIKKDGTQYKTKLASRFPKPLLDWLGKSNKNFNWAIVMAKAIQIKLRPNYFFSNDKLFSRADNLQNYLPDNALAPFPNYAKSILKGIDLTHLPVHEAYNQYLEMQL